MHVSGGGSLGLPLVSVRPAVKIHSFILSSCCIEIDVRNHVTVRGPTSDFFVCLRASYRTRKKDRNEKTTGHGPHGVAIRLMACRCPHARPIYMARPAARPAARRARADRRHTPHIHVTKVRALRYATHPDPSTRPNEIANTHNDKCGCNVSSRHRSHDTIKSARV